MKDKQFWFNLPVNDVNLSRRFYLDIGFELNAQFQQNDKAASLYVGDKKIILMLFPAEIFKGFVKNDTTNTGVSNEVLFNLSAENKAEVDAMVHKVK